MQGPSLARCPPSWLAELIVPTPLLSMMVRGVSARWQGSLVKYGAQIRPDRQTLLWSATWPKEVQTLSREFLTNPYQVEPSVPGILAPWLPPSWQLLVMLAAVARE